MTPQAHQERPTKTYETEETEVTLSLSEVKVSAKTVDHCLVDLRSPSTEVPVP